MQECPIPQLPAVSRLSRLHSTLEQAAFAALSRVILCAADYRAGRDHTHPGRASSYKRGPARQALQHKDHTAQPMGSRKAPTAGP